jgi:ribosomal silencing factor RsfS
MDRIASKNLEEKNQVEQEELEGEEEEEWVMADYLQNS